MKLITTIIKYEEKNPKSAEVIIDDILLSNPNSHSLWYITIDKNKYFVNASEDIIYTNTIERILRVTSLDNE